MSARARKKKQKRILARRKENMLNDTKNSCCSRKLIINFFTHQLIKGGTAEEGVCAVTLLRAPKGTIQQLRCPPQAAGAGEAALSGDDICLSHFDARCAPAAEESVNLANHRGLLQADVPAEPVLQLLLRSVEIKGSDSPLLLQTSAPGGLHHLPSTITTIASIQHPQEGPGEDVHDQPWAVRPPCEGHEVLADELNSLNDGDCFSCEEKDGNPPNYNINVRSHTLTGHLRDGEKKQTAALGVADAGHGWLGAKLEPMEKLSGKKSEKQKNERSLPKMQTLKVLLTALGKKSTKSSTFLPILVLLSCSRVIDLQACFSSAQQRLEKTLPQTPAQHQMHGGLCTTEPCQPSPYSFSSFFSISRARSVGASRAAKHPPLRLVPTEVARQRAETVTRTQWEATLMDTRGTTQGSATILFNTFHGSLHPSEMRESRRAFGKSLDLEALTDALIWRDLGFASIEDSPGRRKEKTKQNKITRALFSSPNPFMTFFSGQSLPGCDTAGGEAAPGEGTLPTLDGAVALDMKEQTHPALI
ncbi:hypothetical protein Anapl_08723 [Anas platyrhynchos]|uniref:Uncharacterized protein n=1 Tax=Anas platyrhynchos TaxID=8839 RepID=R0KY63_ANAPL|nr:hypothetical protein Anapl_08723 [Anas platyrhynchos]